MSDSIVVSLNGDSIAITTKTTTGGLLLSKMELLSLFERFIGDRRCFYRRQAKVASDTVFESAMNEVLDENASLLARFPRRSVDWIDEMARCFGVAAFFSERLLPDSSECWDCGRLVKDPGLCGDCADRKAGLR